MLDHIFLSVSDIKRSIGFYEATLHHWVSPCAWTSTGTAWNSSTKTGSTAVARRVLKGDRRSGFATPAQVFGGGFAESIDGTLITDR